MVKELLPEVGTAINEKATFQTFQNEVVIMSCLQHEKIIQLIGVSLHPAPSFVLELAVFGDLAHAIIKLSKTPFPWRDRLKVKVMGVFEYFSYDYNKKILIDVADAMAFCHRQSPPITHRDLKSPNVFLSSSKEGGLCAKVADLGMATVLSQRTTSVDNWFVFFVYGS